MAAAEEGEGNSFSCVQREYLYFFVADGLDLQAMREAGRMFEGTHDFRNFCKMDAVNVENYERTVSLFGIEPIDGSAEEGSSSSSSSSSSAVWAMRVRGTAFLWHQVRCMAAVLFLVGAAREPPQVVEQMLRVSEWQRKPQYAMASEGPLLLAHCAFQGLTFHTSPRAAATVRAHLNGMLHSSLVQSAMLRTIHSSVAPTGIVL